MDFQKIVWKAIYNIPYGKLTNYDYWHDLLINPKLQELYEMWWGRTLLV
jgi:O6-methylguanine-DNA--protein-cysteine methyltransferase